jgi:hypothetical protein
LTILLPRTSVPPRCLEERARCPSPAHTASVTQLTTPADPL